MKIHTIPALETNYFWLLQPDPRKSGAYIVDPGDHLPVLRAIKGHKLVLEGIIITHHHWDHTNGIAALLQRFPVPVYGPDSAKIPSVTHKLYHGDTLSLPNLSLEVIGTPGHTLDHLSYLHRQTGAYTLFSADNIFGAGCGRLFEGTPKQFLKSLKRLITMPDDTKIYCSHEYTQQNLIFAKMLEPNNTAIDKRIREVEQLRLQRLPTIPTTIGAEKATNPFLRCHIDTIHRTAERYCGMTLTTDTEVFAIIRQWKDEF